VAAAAVNADSGDTSLSPEHSLSEVQRAQTDWRRQRRHIAEPGAVSKVKRCRCANRLASATESASHIQVQADQC
jgi:hypothetical protein